jgi:DNA repair exonuclease SbcCD nuclease subunit
MIKVLLLADTHLGFDQPLRPRVERRRRGPDFFANTRHALDPARRGEVDLVVHGGDLLYRSKVPPALVSSALEPLLEVADLGVPVVLVPGNHERSAVPFPMLACHEHLHVFDRPRTFVLTVAGTRVAVLGFPCERDRIRDRFGELVESALDGSGCAAIRLLCFHQTVEGARVKGYTFRSGDDVVRGADIPGGFAAVLSGHIHRSQILTHDLAGRPLAAPVIYPGSVERTSFAERDEAKGFWILHFEPDEASGGRLVRSEVRELPARPMYAIAVDATNLEAQDLERAIRTELAGLADDAVVSLRIEGRLEPGSEAVIKAAYLRRLHPPTMTVTLRVRRPT